MVENVQPVSWVYCVLSIESECIVYVLEVKFVALQFKPPPTPLPKN